MGTEAASEKIEFEERDKRKPPLGRAPIVSAGTPKRSALFRL